MVTEIRYETPAEAIAGIEGKAIFLAGVTVRGHQQHLTSWRFECIEEFNRQGFEGTLIIPEFVSKTESDKGKAWIPLWEFEGLKRADVIMFWVPRTRELIGLTTNWEHGYWVGRDHEKLVYGRPDEAYRMGYIDIMWEAAILNKTSLSAPPIYKTLSDTVAAAISKSDDEEYVLDYCEKCIQLTNHLHGNCQKCKARRRMLELLNDEKVREIAINYARTSGAWNQAEAESKWDSYVSHQKNTL